MSQFAAVLSPQSTRKLAWWVLRGNAGVFPDRSAWDKLARALGDVVDAAAFASFSGTASLPFSAGEHRRVAVKVIDPRGNEVMQTHILE